MEGHPKGAEEGQLPRRFARVGRPAASGLLTERNQVGTSSGSPSAPLGWPDLHKDAVAMDQAQKELGENAGIRDLLKRAQEIKEKL